MVLASPSTSSMESQRRQDQCLQERKGQKRKLENELGDEDREISVPSGDARQALLTEVSAQVNILNSAFSWTEADRAAAKRATHVLAELAKNGKVTESSRKTLLRSRHISWFLLSLISEISIVYAICLYV